MRFVLLLVGVLLLTDCALGLCLDYGIVRPFHLVLPRVAVWLRHLQPQEPSTTVQISPRLRLQGITWSTTSSPPVAFVIYRSRCWWYLANYQDTWRIPFPSWFGLK